MIDTNAPISLADLTVAAGIIGGVLGLWWRVETRVSSGAKAAMKKAVDVEATLNEYKLEVAENYAKNGFIRDVEARLGARFDAIVEELHGMRKDLQDAVLGMAAGRGVRRGK